jgi:hypothetical protein
MDGVVALTSQCGIKKEQKDANNGSKIILGTIAAVLTTEC